MDERSPILIEGKKAYIEKRKSIYTGGKCVMESLF